MKLKKVALFSVLGMFISSASVFALTGESSESASVDGVMSNLAGAVSADVQAPVQLARFAIDGTLRGEARMGHPRMRQNGANRTYLALEVQGADRSPNRRPPVHMSLVIDRSGSMKGSRLGNALQAARGVVDRLADGDAVSVISFDTRTDLVVPTTTLTATSRSRIRDALGDIRLGGDTCISCGVEHAMRELRAHRAGGNAVERILVLSDGEANNGVRDVEGFSRIARTCRTRGVPVSTIGVGLDYNEQILGALAFESNGNHHFVENDRSLPAVFAAETQGALTTVASGVQAEFTLAPGVELVSTFNRAFTRVGNRVVVPLGNLARVETKTVLLELAVDTTEAGGKPIANVSLRFSDLVEDKAGQLDGALSTTVGDSADPLDPFVMARVERSRTSAALSTANDFAKKGDFGLARRTLQKRLSQLKINSTKAKLRARGTAPKPKQASLDRDFKRQIEFAEEAVDNFKSSKGKKKPKPAPAKRGVRQNQSRMNTLDL
jgi:Ca-activated chloride channel family protein